MQASGRILIVEDDVSTRSVLAEILSERGYEVETVADGSTLLAKLDAFAPAVILTDLGMPGLAGIDLLNKVRDCHPSAIVVLMTTDSAVATAVSAMKQGAADYLIKPINFEHLLVVIERELQRYRLKTEADLLRMQLAERRGINNIIGASSVAMQPMCNTIVMVAPSRASILITGESGTGKELVAAAIHEISPRRLGPFVKLHCASLAEALLESELFGHERGAFTGANARREGRFEQANHGTLFLDEIGEISPSLQVKLLRFLQEHEFERVGGNQTVKVDVRIIAATNRDLMKEVREGRFREDLYYRLNVVSIPTLPLRAMTSNIPALAMHFLRRFAEENVKPVTGFTDGALALLASHAWPGNVRELENAVERGVLCSQAPFVQASDLGLNVQPLVVADMPAIPGATLAEIEKFAVIKTLEHTAGSTSRAAAILDVSPRKLQYRLKEYSTPPGAAGSKSAPLNS
jgi:DNA-binding NtrC family response regulator